MATGAAYQRRSVVNLGPIHAEAAPAEVVEGGASAAKGDGADGSAGGWVAPTSTYERIRSGSFSFLADNEFIHTGYRHGMTYKQAFVSLFQLHNETSNVLSHLIGAVVFLGLFIHVMSGGLQGDYAQKVVAGGRGIMRLAAGEIQAFKTYAGGKLGVEFGVVPPACTLTTVGDGATERVGCGPETDASADFRAAFAALRDSLGASAEALRAGAGARAESMWGEGAALAADLSLYATRAASEAEGVVDALVASGGQGRRAAGEKLTALLLPMMDKARRLGDLLDVEELGGAGGGASRVARDALTRVATGVSTAWHALERLGGLPQEAIDAIEAGTAAGGGGDRPHADRIPIFPLAIFAASALVCLGTSATFHLLHVVDRGAFEMLARADYTGIAILTAGSMYPPVVYGFLCSPGWTRVYLGITTLASAATVVLGMVEAFRTPAWRPVRAGAFVVAGLSGVPPLVHLLLFNSHHLEDASFRTGVHMLLVMGAQYLSGALIYATRLPERWLPGRFDYVFQSHFIFHVLVFGAALAHWHGSVSFYHWRLLQPVCPE